MGLLGFVYRVASPAPALESWLACRELTDRTSKFAALMRKLMAVRPVAAAMPKRGAGELVDVGPEQLALGRLARQWTVRAEPLPRKSAPGGLEEVDAVSYGPPQARRDCRMIKGSAW